MKRAVFAALFVFAVWGCIEASGASGRFEKVSDHCYYFQLKSGENIAAIATDDGILLLDPPPEPDLSLMMDALKRLSSKRVRWVVFSNPRFARSAAARFFADQGAMLIGGAQLVSLSTSIPGTDAKDAAPAGSSGDVPSYPWLIFEHQIHLFPSNLEIRIMALEPKALTGGDVVLHLPAEKVLLLGRLYESARYPDIDVTAQGNARTWVDGLKQVVDSVPVLKPAIPPKPAVPPQTAPAPKPAVSPKTSIPQAKVDPKTEPEVTLEEGIAVLSAKGEVSNLQNMKDLLSACQKVRNDILRALKAGRSCENFKASSRADIYRIYGNFDHYATQLCEGLASEK